MSSPDSPPTDVTEVDVAHRDFGPQRPPEESLRRGFETRDVNVRGILWLAASVSGTVALALVVLSLLLTQLQGEARRADPELSPLATSPRPPPPPRLQNTPIRDFAEYQRDQQAQLDSYGWVDAKQGIVRIPIEKAMDLALERGLPAPKAAPPQKDGGETKAKEDAEK